MYKIPKYTKTQLVGAQKVEGETIEIKVKRMVHEKEPIKDGAPLIYTERKEGVNAAYNIRTDRWEIAVDALDVIAKSEQAKRDNLIQKEKEDAKIIDMTDKNSKAEPTHGKAQNESK